MDGKKTLLQFKKLHRVYKRNKRLGQPVSLLEQQLEQLDDKLAITQPQWRKRAYKGQNEQY